MKGSLIIIGFFVLGTLCGIFHLIPVDAVMDSKVSFYALCALMFSVGLSVGNDPQTLKNFRSLNPRLVFLPIMTILGTLAGSAAVSLILTHRSLTGICRIRSLHKTPAVPLHGAASSSMPRSVSRSSCIPYRCP